MIARPLILSPHEVRAALADTLGLVVRPVKFRSDINFNDVHFSSFHSTWGPDSWVFSSPLLGPGGYETISVGMQCPLGVPGDRLRCRETWKALGHPINEYAYAADGVESGPWEPATRMPEAASRITLEVVGVRCVRCTDITYEDAEKSGVADALLGTRGMSPLTVLRDNWTAKYAHRYPWETSWAWAVEVRRVEG